jgi:hypothetical protein
MAAPAPCSAPAAGGDNSLLLWRPFHKRLSGKSWLLSREPHNPVRASKEGRMDDLMRWACELLGFSGCYGFSPWEKLLSGGGLIIVAFVAGLLVAGFLIGRLTR